MKKKIDLAVYAKENLGRRKCMISKALPGQRGTQGKVCGYSPDNGWVIIGFNDARGWSKQSLLPTDVILKKYETYYYVMP